MKSGAEIKVGVVAAAALVVLGLIIYYFIGTFLARLGYPLDVIFDRAEVRAGDSVLMAGVPVGRVESLSLTKENEALVRLRINSGVTLREGYAIHLVAASMLGEKYLEIRTAPPEQAGPVLKPGSTIRGVPAVRFEDLLAGTQAVLHRMNQVADSVTGLVSDEKLRATVRTAIASLGQAAQDTGALARELRGMATQARPQVRRVLANVEAASRDLRGASSVLAKLGETSIPENLEEASARLRTVMERVDDVVAELQMIVTDPETRELVTTAARNLRDTTETIRQASEEIRAAAESARATTNSIKEAAKDAPAIMSNVRETSQNIRDASVEIKGMASEARSSLPQVTQKATKAVKAIGELPRVRGGLNVGAQYLTRDDRWWVDVNADLRTNDRVIRVGVADLGETNRLNLQVGQRLGSGRLRYGVVQSDVGVGYDWALTPWLTLSAEAFDPNELRANVFGYWGLGGTLRGWNAVVGYRGIGGGGSPAVGVRLEK